MTATLASPSGTTPSPARSRTRTRTIVLWVAAFVLTVVFAGYQRRTGPTWPVTIRSAIAGSPVNGKLPRSHAGTGGARIELATAAGIAGDVVWRRYPTNEAWTVLPMTMQGGTLSAELPHFPPAAKVEYEVRLRGAGSELTLPASGQAVVLRYRGDVPAWVLIPHILMMFGGLLLGTRLAFGALAGEPGLARLFPWLFGVLVPGGLVLGPLVQKFAFDAYWTGWPVGEDLTDTKTLVTVVGWWAAWLVMRRAPRATRVAILAAAALMVAVYLVPHSARGSQLDWKTVPGASSSAR